VVDLNETKSDLTFCKKRQVAEETFSTVEVIDEIPFVPLKSLVAAANAEEGSHIGRFNGQKH
jgi:hypothetical protein